ncbi:MAG TPA: NTP transferase domain-containing protein, partial [bacterium]|nr:NTP transferase domain-containing protein [bacterium]
MPKSGGPEPGLAAIGAVILAAGSGRRIGTPKLRLEAAGRSYLELILDRLGEAEIAPVACVVAADQSAWAGPRLAAASRM